MFLREVSISVQFFDCPVSQSAIGKRNKKSIIEVRCLGKGFNLINICFGVVLSGFKPSLCYYTYFFILCIVTLLSTTPYI